MGGCIGWWVCPWFGGWVGGWAGRLVYTCLSEFVPVGGGPVIVFGTSFLSAIPAPLWQTWWVGGYVPVYTGPAGEAAAVPLVRVYYCRVLLPPAVPRSIKP